MLIKENNQIFDGYQNRVQEDHSDAGSDMNAYLNGMDAEQCLELIKSYNMDLYYEVEDALRKAMADDPTEINALDVGADQEDTDSLGGVSNDDNVSF